jgi:hypothetical protein
MFESITKTIIRVFGGARPAGKSVFTPATPVQSKNVALANSSALMASVAQLAPLAHLNKDVTPYPLRQEPACDLSTDPLNPLGSVVIRRKSKGCYIVVISDKLGREIARCSPMVSHDSALRAYAALQALVMHPDTLLPTKAGNE